MLVKSTRFGDLTVDEQDILTFCNGLPGFPKDREFVLLPSQGSSPFVFLQSVQEANLTFVLVEPFDFFPDYEFNLDNEMVQNFGISENNLPQVFNIVTVPENIEKMTVNLLAPVIINAKTRQGVQIVLEKSQYTTKHILFPQGLPKPSQKGGR